MRRGIKTRLIVLGSLLAVLLIAGGVTWGLVHYYLIRTEPLTQSQIEDLQIDYTPMTKGRWSPWQTDSDGEQVWNPVAGYNGWVRTLEDEELAWPELHVWHVEHFEITDRIASYGSPHEIKNLDDVRAWHSDPVNLDTTNRLIDILDRRHMGVILTDLDSEEFIDHNTPNAAELRDGGVRISLFLALRPHLGIMRRACCFLHNGAIIAIEQADSDRFVELVIASMISASLLDEFPMAIDELVRVAILQHAYATIAWALEQYPERFNDHQLQMLDEVIAKSEVNQYMHLGEQMVLEDGLRRYATKSGKFRFAAIADAIANDIELVDKFGPPTNVPSPELHESLQQPMWIVLQLNQHGADSSKLPWNGNDIYMPSIDSFGLELNPVSSKFMSMFTAAYDRVASRFLSHYQERIGLRTTIALHRHKLRHGGFPESVSEIDADLLGFGPIDLFTNEPLLMTMRDGQIRVYSTGPDRIDDNGEPIWREMLGSDARTYERGMQWISAESAQDLMEYSPNEIAGDFVLFPTPRDDPYEDEYEDD